MTKFVDHDAQTGVTTTVHHIDDADRVVIEKSYDKKPFVDLAAAVRAETEGQKWGEMRHIGFIPNAELATMMRQDGTIDQKRVAKFLKANPMLCTFSKALQ